MAREVHENGDKMTGDSVCSTLSDCSLLERNRFHDQRKVCKQTSNERVNCFGAEDNTDMGGDDVHNAPYEDHDGHGAAFGADAKEEDNATFRTIVMHQFKDDIDRLLQTVAQKVEKLRNNGAVCAGGGCINQLSTSSQPNVYSVVKSGCLSLLLSRVLPPLQEQFEQRLIESLQNAGLLPGSSGTSRQLRQQRSIASEVSNAQDPRYSTPAPTRPLTAHTLPKPAPRLRTSAESWLVPSPLASQLEHHPVVPEFCGSQGPHNSALNSRQLQTPCPPRPPPRLLNSAESATTPRPSQPPPPKLPRPAPPAPLPLPPSAVCQFRQLQGQNRIPSPYFVQQKMLATTTARSASSAVRNNSSLKPTSPIASSKAVLLPRPRHLCPPPPASCCHLVRTFMIRDSPTLRAVLFDPDDRKMKSFSQRYGCYINLYEVSRRAGHLLHKVIIRAPSEKALRMCISALDSGLNWDLASQMNWTIKKPVPSLSK